MPPKRGKKGKKPQQNPQQKPAKTAAKPKPKPSKLSTQRTLTAAEKSDLQSLVTDIFKQASCFRFGCRNKATRTCTGCLTARYCSRECQVQCWTNIHKPVCTVLAVCGQGSGTVSEELESLALELIYQQSPDLSLLALTPRVATSLAAAMLDHFARVHSEQGEFKQTMQLYNKTIELLTGACGPNSVEVASAMVNIALIHHEHGEYKQAMELHTKAMEIETNVHGPNSAEVATTIQNIAMVHCAQGEFKRAVELYNQALGILTTTCGQNSRQVASTLYNMAVVQYNLGDYKQAMQLYDKVMEIQARVFGVASREVANTMKNIANMHNQQGDLDQAMQWYNKALKIFTGLYGPNSKDVAHTMGNMAVVYRKRKQFTEAMQLYNRALEINTRVFGPNNKDVAALMGNMANLHSDQREFTQAMQLHNKALDIQTRVFGPNSKEVAGTLANIANIHSQLGNFQQARQMHNKALEIQTRVFGPNSAEVARTMYYMSAGWHMQNESKDVDQAPKQTDHAALIGAVRSQNKAKVDEILKTNNALGDTVGSDGETALSCACSIGSVSMINVVLDHKVRIDIKNKRNQLPWQLFLHYCQTNNNNNNNSYQVAPDTSSRNVLQRLCPSWSVDNHQLFKYLYSDHHKAALTMMMLLNRSGCVVFKLSANHELVFHIFNFLFQH